MAANENHNYKIVGPTYYNKNDRGAIICLTSVLVGELKSHFALLLFNVQEKNEISYEILHLQELLGLKLPHYTIMWQI